jgi:hypothetical protein
MGNNYIVFDEYLDECWGSVVICGFQYDVSEAFKLVDPIAYEESYIIFKDNNYPNHKEQEK